MQKINKIEEDLYCFKFDKNNKILNEYLSCQIQMLNEKINEIIDLLNKEREDKNV